MGGDPNVVDRGKVNCAFCAAFNFACTHRAELNPPSKQKQICPIKASSDAGCRDGSHYQAFLYHVMDCPECYTHEKAVHGSHYSNEERRETEYCTEGAGLAKGMYDFIGELHDKFIADESMDYTVTE